MTFDFLELLGDLQRELGIRHIEPSAILSADDDRGRPNGTLFDVAFRSILAAVSVDLSDISGRLSQPPSYPEIWPGEHYKLLAGIVEASKPNLVVEVGTATGLSALALKKYLAPNARLITFDIVPWSEFPDKVLFEDDFEDGRLQQIVADLTRLEVAREHADLLRQADFLFIDAAKDGTMERVLLDNLSSLGLKTNAILVFDDIRFMAMIPIWRCLAIPKMDLTSFGHWSGTGLALWTGATHWTGKK